MKIRGKILSISEGYNSSTMEVRIIDVLGNRHLNIVPKIKANKGDVVLCTMYENLYSIQVERIVLVK